MARKVWTATIPAGASLSSIIDLFAGTAVFLHMPPEWTPALLSFQISHDGNENTFSNAVDMMSNELAYNVLGGTTIRMGTDWASSAAGYMRFRSGTMNYPIVQEADRIITISGIT